MVGPPSKPEKPEKKDQQKFQNIEQKNFSRSRKFRSYFFVRQFVRYFFMTLCWKKYQIFSFSLIPKYVCNVFILVQVIDVSWLNFLNIIWRSKLQSSFGLGKNWKCWLLLKYTVILKKENVFHIKIRFKTYLKTCWRYCQMLQNLLSAFFWNVVLGLLNPQYKDNRTFQTTYQSLST